MAVRRHPVVAGLEPYCELVDVAERQDLILELGWSKAGWHLHISKSLDEDPLVGVDARLPTPGCFNRLAAHAAARLGKLK